MVNKQFSLEEPAQLLTILSARQQRRHLVFAKRTEELTSDFDLLPSNRSLSYTNQTVSIQNNIQIAKEIIYVSSGANNWKHAFNCLS